MFFFKEPYLLALLCCFLPYESLTYVGFCRCIVRGELEDSPLKITIPLIKTVKDRDMKVSYFLMYKLEVLFTFVRSLHCFDYILAAMLSIPFLWLFVKS